MTDYPYMLSNNKILPIIQSLQSAAKPNKFTTEFLKNMGFNSSNDRAVLNLFKRLGFLTADGVPTGYYDQLRDKVLYKKLLLLASENYTPTYLLLILRYIKRQKLT